MYCKSKLALDADVKLLLKLLVWKETSFLLKVLPEDKSPFTKML